MMILPSSGAVAPPLMLSEAAHSLLIVAAPSSARIAGGQVSVSGPHLWVWPNTALLHRSAQRFELLPAGVRSVATALFNVDRLDTARLFRLRILPTRQTACPPNVCVDALMEDTRP